MRSLELDTHDACPYAVHVPLQHVNWDDKQLTMQLLATVEKGAYEHLAGASKLVLLGRPGEGSGIIID